MNQSDLPSHSGSCSAGGWRSGGRVSPWRDLARNAWASYRYETMVLAAAVVFTPFLLSWAARHPRVTDTEPVLYVPAFQLEIMFNVSLAWTFFAEWRQALRGQPRGSTRGAGRLSAGHDGPVLSPQASPRMVGHSRLSASRTLPVLGHVARSYIRGIPGAFVTLLVLTYALHVPFISARLPLLYLSIWGLFISAELAGKTLSGLSGRFPRTVRTAWWLALAAWAVMLLAKAAGSGYLMSLPLIAVGETLQGAPWEHLPPFKWGMDSLFIATNRVGVWPMGYPLLGLAAMIVCAVGLGRRRVMFDSSGAPTHTGY